MSGSTLRKRQKDFQTRYVEPRIEEYWLVGGNDLHCGSVMAPMPERVEMELPNGEVEVRTPNPVQAQLNAYWKEMLESLPPLTGVIVNGDVCEGPNRKEYGKELWTQNLKVQVQAAAELGLRIKREE